MTGRPEAPFGPECLPHLIPLALEMRKARAAAGHRLTDLATPMGYQASYLSRASSAKMFPPKPLVLAWAKECGVSGLRDWEVMWDTTREAHKQYQRDQREGKKAGTVRPSSPAPSTLSFGVGGGEFVVQLKHNKTPGEIVTTPAISAMLRDAERPEDLVTAIRALADRADRKSLRQMAEASKISKSTLQDWLSAKTMPTRLDELVIALGARPNEQRLFATCMERVWSRREPMLVHAEPVYTPHISSKYGGFAYAMDFVLLDRSVITGMVEADYESDLIAGISVSPYHGMGPSDVAPMPKLARKATFSILIWTRAAAVPPGTAITLEFALQTSETEGVWVKAVEVVLPSVSTTETIIHGAPASPRPARPGPESSTADAAAGEQEQAAVRALGRIEPPQLYEMDGLPYYVPSAESSDIDAGRGKHRRPRKGLFKSLLSLVSGPDSPT